MCEGLKRLCLWAASQVLWQPGEKHRRVCLKARGPTKFPRCSLCFPLSNSQAGHRQKQAPGNGGAVPWGMFMQEPRRRCRSTAHNKTWMMKIRFMFGCLGHGPTSDTGDCEAHVPRSFAWACQARLCTWRCLSNSMLGRCLKQCILNKGTVRDEWELQYDLKCVL